MRSTLPAEGRRQLTVPVIASTVGFDGDAGEVTTSVLPASAVAAARSGHPGHIAAVLSSERGIPVHRARITAATAWRDLLGQLRSKGSTVQVGSLQLHTTAFAQTLGQYLDMGPVSYRTVGRSMV